MTPAPRRAASLTLLLALCAGPVLHAQLPATAMRAPTSPPPRRTGTPLTLAAALAVADSAAFANRQAAGRLGALEAEAGLATAGLLPAVRTEATLLRTTDPLQAFGLRLRQRGVTPAAFAPDQLNNPRAIGNVGTAAVAEVPLLVPSAWQERRAARAAVAAGAAARRWTQAEVRTAVLQDYAGAQLADAAIAVVTAALETARAAERDAESAVRQGVATRSDLLLAAVRRAALETQLAETVAGAALAQDALAVRLGDVPSDRWCLADPIGGAAALKALALAEQSSAPGLDAAEERARPDLEAARLGVTAAAEAARGARAALLPRIAAFGRLDWNTPQAAFAGQSAWTIGLQAVWTPFSGGREVAGIRLADARRRTADAAYDAARATAAVEHRDAARRLAVALDRLESAGDAVGQAAEAERIVARKYRGGLATIVETLDAAAVGLRTRLQELEARQALLLAIAEWRRVRGLDPVPPLETTPVTGAAC